MPTAINNVETVANLSLLLRGGESEFRAQGDAAAPGTKLFSLSGRVSRPGLYELPLGTPLARLLDAAGGPIQGEFTAVLAGGPSGGFLPPSEFHRPLLPGLMHPTGAVAGSGGMVALDSSSDLRLALLEIARFNAHESCGKCTPCREGLPRVVEALESRQSEGLDDLLEVVGLASLCGLGQMAPGPVRSARYFWPELFP
jgi:NADH:ubiquinone oxidoreductase subunit F (NADH-binding)